MQELEATPAFESHLSKYRSLMPSLALLFHLVNLAGETLATGATAEAFGSSVGEIVEGSAGNNPPLDQLGVSLEAAQLAAAWCEYLELHARKVYSAELYPGAEAAEVLGIKIQQGDIVDGQSVRDIYRHGWTGLSTMAQVGAAIDVLEKAGWVRVVSVETGGRPTERLRVRPELRGEVDA